jgi:hypothetical protein
MNSARRPYLVLAALTTLALAGAARAADPEVVATAAPAGSGAPPSNAPSGAGASSSVADQIDAYLKSSPALALPKDGPGGVTTADEPRQIHGFVDVAAGSNGYRSAFVESEIPVGKTGTATIAIGETRFDGRSFGGRGFGGPGYRGPGGSSQNLALGLALGGAEPTDWRCRQAMEAAEARPDDGPPAACRTRLSQPTQ